MRNTRAKVREMVTRRHLREGDAWPPHAYHFGLIPDHKYHVKRDPSSGDWNVAVKNPAIGDHWMRDWIFSSVECDTLVAAINRVACRFHGQPGGSFYYNEYHQVLKPIGDEHFGSELRYVGEFEDCWFEFELDGGRWVTRPDDDDCPNGLQPGDEWWGPKCGVPYKIERLGRIYRPRVTWFEDDPVSVSDRYYLDEHVADYSALSAAIGSVKRGNGGKFYVTEAGLIWAPYKWKRVWRYGYVGYLWDLVEDWYPKCG